MTTSEPLKPTISAVDAPHPLQDALRELFYRTDGWVPFEHAAWYHQQRDAIMRSLNAPAADRAVSELPALRQPMPDDLLTVANIESDGITLTLEINQLGDLVHLIGEDERTCTLTIAPMRRADFDDLGDFDGF